MKNNGISMGELDKYGCGNSALYRFAAERGCENLRINIRTSFFFVIGSAGSINNELSRYSYI